MGPQAETGDHDTLKMAQIEISDGRYASAEQLNRTAISLWEQSAGPDHPSMLPWLARQAVILRKMKRGSEAAEFDKRAAAIRAKYGSDASRYSIDVSLLEWLILR
jgi:hypothetical protein